MRILYVPVAELIGYGDLPPGTGGEPGGFTLGFQPPSVPCIPEVLLPIGETVESLRLIIASAVSRCLSAGQISVARCQSCVNQSLAGEIQRVTAICDRLGLACGAQISALYAMAWETAATAGCDVPISIEYDPGQVRECPTGREPPRGPPATDKPPYPCGTKITHLVGPPNVEFGAQLCNPAEGDPECGTCCLPDARCIDSDQRNCELEGGVWSGTGPTCSEPIACQTCPGEPPPTTPPPPITPPPPPPENACPCPEGYEIKELYCCPECGHNQIGAPPGPRPQPGPIRRPPGRCGPYRPDGPYTENCGMLQAGSPLPWPAEVTIPRIGQGSIVEVFPEGTVFEQEVRICTFCPVEDGGPPPTEEPPGGEDQKCKKCCSVCVPKGQIAVPPLPPPPLPKPYPYPYPVPTGDGGACPPCPPSDRTCPPPVIEIPPCPEPPDEKLEYWVGHDCEAKRCMVVEKHQKVDDARFEWYGPFKKIGTALNRARSLCPPEGCPHPAQPGIAVDMTGIDWNDPRICSILPSIPVNTHTEFRNFTTAIWGLRDLRGRPIETDEQRGFTWMGIPFGKISTAIFRWVADTAGIAQRTMLDLSGCANDKARALAQTRMSTSLLSILAPAVHSYLETPVRYLHQYYCPLELPSAEGILQLYLTGQIDEDTYVCWTRAQGRLPTQSVMLTRAARSKLNPGEITALWLRDLIDQPEMDRRLRELGYLDERDYGDFRLLSQQIPVLTDITRFMVRDVDDEQAVRRFGMDDLFGQKFGRQLREWAKQQGIGEQYARYYWRAHWRLPSPTQLYEMYHRLRHDWIPEGERVTLDDIKTSLTQDDLLPFWLDKYVAISFRPLTRVDTRRAFEIGAIDRENVRRSYLDQGYSDQNAERLTQFATTQLRIKHTNNRWVKLWGQGHVNREVAERRAREEGLRAEDVDHVFAVQMDLMRARSRSKCIAQVRRRALLGEIEPLDVVHQLENLGLDQNQALILAEGIQCELQARGKLASVSVLCDWFQSGMIDQADYLARLEKLGWDHDDAVLYIRRCIQRLGIRQRREEEQQARREEADRRREQADERRRLAEEERRRRQAATAAERFQKAKERREDALVKGSIAVHEILGLDIKTITDTLRNCANELRRTLGITSDDAIQAVVRAAESGEYQNLEDLCLLAALYAEAERQIDEGGLSSQAPGVPPPGGNGRRV